MQNRNDVRSGLFLGARSGVVSYREPGRPRIATRLIRAARMVDELSPSDRLALLSALDPSELEAAMAGDGAQTAAAEGLIERRAQPRRDYFERARIIAGEGTVIFEGRLLEWSPEGRRIRLSALVEPPKVFQLIGEAMAAPRTLDLVWQDGQTIGARLRR
jgi:hypothetical protein